MRVIGYTADADTWCKTCAEAKYGQSPYDGTYDSHGEFYAHDGEGHEVWPMFDLDDKDVDNGGIPFNCAGCHEPIE